MIESISAKKEIKTEKNYNELAKYLVKRLNVLPKISIDYNQFNDFTKRIEIKIPEKMVKKMASVSTKELNSNQISKAIDGSFFWIEQSLNTFNLFGFNSSQLAAFIIRTKPRYLVACCGVGIHFVPKFFRSISNDCQIEI